MRWLIVLLLVACAPADSDTRFDVEHAMSHVDALVKISDGESVPSNLDVGVKMFGEEGIQDYLDKGWQ